ncbi:hypothetical protein V5799_019881 [Amblyomma americanum]|uniref:Uncharacterized protein n=1 Tax=Amblyomma americanum TaxID=6943 RepID=A0AAQ4EVN4_AMBAM
MAQASGRSGCAAPSTEQASRGVIPWVADTSYFHWAPGSEARRLDAPSCDGGADSSASGSLSTYQEFPPLLLWTCLRGVDFHSVQAGACGVAFYTYCPVLRDEYRASTRDRMCVPSGADRVAVCNRGRNRFASLEECHRACALLQGPTRETCYEQPLFTACHKQDVVGAWWYFDGFRCAEWDFPHGECPLNSTGGGVDVYSSLDECRAQCDAGGRRRCRPPASATCDSGQLRFPYFARLLPNGRGLCASASLGTLFAHRCLVGANRFDSLATCRDTCLRQ